MGKKLKGKVWTDREYVHLEGLYRAGLPVYQIHQIFRRREEPIVSSIGPEIMALLYPRSVFYPGRSLHRLVELKGATLTDALGS
jgi:transcriptional regulator of nitric oxide reductase